MNTLTPQTITSASVYQNPDINDDRVFINGNPLGPGKNGECSGGNAEQFSSGPRTVMANPCQYIKISRSGELAVKSEPNADSDCKHCPILEAAGYMPPEA